MIFEKIAASMHITDRYVGKEPTSQVTGIYNTIMAEELPKAGISCHILPRKEADGQAISASTVRQCLQQGDFDLLGTLVPKSTYRYFTSPEATPVIRKIQNSGNVIHY